MQNIPLNFRIAPTGKAEEPAQAAADLGRMEELLEQTKSDVARTRIQFEQERQENESHRRRTSKALSIILAALVVGLIGALWLASPFITRQRAAERAVLGLKNTVDTMGASLNSVGTQLRDSTAAVPGLTDRMDQLQESMNSNMESARTQATQIGQRIKGEVNRSLQTIQSRIAGLESNQHEAHDRVTKLQQEIAGLRGEVATLRTDATVSAGKIKELSDGQQNGAEVLSNIDRRVVSNRAAVDALAKEVDRQRIDFVVTRNQTQQVAPGFYLTVKRADVGKQQINGSIRITAEGRDVTIRDLAVQRPMIFYTRGTYKPLELIVTKVTKDGVTGYLVKPPSPLAAAKSDDAGLPSR